MQDAPFSLWRFLALGGASGQWHDGYIQDKQPRAEGWQGVEVGGIRQGSGQAREVGLM